MIGCSIAFNNDSMRVRQKAVETTSSTNDLKIEFYKNGMVLHGVFPVINGLDHIRQKRDTREFEYAKIAECIYETDSHILSIDVSGWNFTQYLSVTPDIVDEIEEHSPIEIVRLFRVERTNALGQNA